MATHYVVAIYRKDTNSFDGFCSFNEEVESFRQVTTNLEEAQTMAADMNAWIYADEYSYVVKEIDL